MQNLQSVWGKFSQLFTSDWKGCAKQLPCRLLGHSCLLLLRLMSLMTQKSCESIIKEQVLEFCQWFFISDFLSGPVSCLSSFLLGFSVHLACFFGVIGLATISTFDFSVWRRLLPFAICYRLDWAWDVFALRPVVSRIAQLKKCSFVFPQLCIWRLKWSYGCNYCCHLRLIWYLKNIMFEIVFETLFVLVQHANFQACAVNAL